MRTYAALLSRPGARGAVATALPTRIAIGTLSLSVLLVVVEAGRGFAVAGLASAALAAGTAVGSPVLGRRVDRHGRTRVVAVAGTLAAAVLVAAAVAAPRAPVAVLVVLAAVAGLLVPPVGPAMRSLWHHLTPDEEQRRQAYAFEATLSELMFVVGPLLVTALVALVGARASAVVVAAVLGGGSIGFALSHAARTAPVTARRARARLSTRPGPLALVLAAVGLTAGLPSALAVALSAALVSRQAQPSWVGLLLAAQSVGSVAAGLYYGTRRRSGPAVDRYLALLAVLAVLAVLLALPVLPLVVPALPAGAALALWAVLLAAAGTPIAPAGTEEFQIVAELSEPAAVTAVFAVVGSVMAAGASAGSALGGLAVDRAGVLVAMLVPCALTVLAALAVVLARRRALAAADAATGRSAAVAS